MRIHACSTRCARSSSAEATLAPRSATASEPVPDPRLPLEAFGAGRRVELIAVLLGRLVHLVVRLPFLQERHLVPVVLVLVDADGLPAEVTQHRLPLLVRLLEALDVRSANPHLDEHRHDFLPLTTDDGRQAPSGRRRKSAATNGRGGTLVGSERGPASAP